ncbi:hypothetical protein DHW03_01610 [Pedobacter yonginense]|uniref:Uncharacterized protein n=1 Tax=Pedobacter yonginense TaxID=651869 RepID=A0A317ETK5_9SPHI|nr:hypothetical protein [Pedobacter yonginense]PWS28576.1 hypothetical protein DHW03_01610 [Pedobacter yonginense]
MSVLNIFDASGDPETGWRHTEKLNESSISQLRDKSAKTTNALNAVPSPFSRIHTFDTAFKLVTSDLVGQQDRASGIYRELVSDCLDAIELVFNANYHISQGDQIDFVNWSTADLTTLLNGTYGQQVLAKTLTTFAEADFIQEPLTISIVKYSGLVIGGSSPFTLMFTSSNLDKSRSQRPDERFRSARYNAHFDLVNPSSGSLYFSKIIPFSKRSAEFKNYLLSIFERNPVMKRNSSKVFWDYLVAEGVGTLTLKASQTKPNVALNGGVFHTAGIALNSNSNVLSTEIFNDHIVRVEYRINENCFHTPTYVHEPERRNFDFLLPIKPEFFNKVKPSDIPKHFRYEILGERVRVIYDNGELDVPRVKDFILGEKTKTEGNIVNVTTDIGGSFLLGIFPFLKVINADGSSNNDYNDF